MSLLVIYELLGLFVNTLTADYNYCRCNRENLLRNQFKCNYLKKKNLFVNSWLTSETYIEF